MCKHSVWPIKEPDRTTKLFQQQTFAFLMMQTKIVETSACLRFFLLSLELWKMPGMAQAANMSLSFWNYQ